MIAALLSAISGGVHGTLAPSLAREAGILGLAFATAAAFQLGAAALLVRRPQRRMLETVAAVNGLLVLAWGVSRILGLPAGPAPWTPEPVELIDVSTVLVELGCLYLCLGLRSVDPHMQPGARARLLLAIVLVAVGAFGLFLLIAAQTHAEHGGPATVHETGHLLHAALLASAFGLVFTTRTVVGALRSRGRLERSVRAGSA